ncbi:LuxR C-terminal-related transcriptional regulator [Alkalihalobacterium sp. APHAB7]|uniref:response regulator transcription factor n=1 Tax=Alkalihalobacterium sp. APHAB7 TaxID=3402081 RepID=UPI003AAF5028
MLKTEDYEKVLKFVSLIQENHEEYYEILLEGIKNVLGYNNLSLFINNNSFQRTTTTFYINSKVLEASKRHYYQMELLNKKKIQNKHILTIEDLISYTPFQNSDYHLNLQRKNKEYYTVFIPLKCESKIIGLIGIHKPLCSGNYSSNEIQILESVSKFISINLKRHLEFKQLQYAKSMLTRSMGELPIGVLVVDKNFSILYKNEVAIKYCPNLNYADKNNPLTKVKEAVLARINSNLTDGLNLTIGELSFRINTHETWDIKDQHFTIYIYSETKQNEDPIERATIEFGLSKREAEIIGLISKGYSNNDIANRLFLSINTVKTHLANIFNKLGVNNRTSVIHKISAS